MQERRFMHYISYKWCFLDVLNNWVCYWSIVDMLLSHWSTLCILFRVLEHNFTETHNNAIWNTFLVLAHHFWLIINIWWSLCCHIWVVVKWICIYVKTHIHTHTNKKSPICSLILGFRCPWRVPAKYN